MNKLENVVLPQSWSYLGGGDRDTYLLNNLLPWIRRLHECDDHGLLLSRKQNPIGCIMLCEVPNPEEYNELMDVVQKPLNRGHLGYHRSSQVHH